MVIIVSGIVVCCRLVGDVIQPKEPKIEHCRKQNQWTMGGWQMAQLYNSKSFCSSKYFNCSCCWSPINGHKWSSWLVYSGGCYRFICLMELEVCKRLCLTLSSQWSKNKFVWHVYLFLVPLWTPTLLWPMMLNWQNNSLSKFYCIV
jgi:hypothetical protein